VGIPNEQERCLTGRLFTVSKPYQQIDPTLASWEIPRVLYFGMGACARYDRRLQKFYGPGYRENAFGCARVRLSARIRIPVRREFSPSQP
jgi:hypothetical protein